MIISSDYVFLIAISSDYVYLIIISLIIIIVINSHNSNLKKEKVWDLNTLFSFLKMCFISNSSIIIGGISTLFLRQKSL